MAEIGSSFKKKDGNSIEKNDRLSLASLTRKHYILFALHNSFPYHSTGYAIRSHHILKTLQRGGISVLAATRLGYPWNLQEFAQQPWQEIDEVEGIQYMRLIPTQAENLRQSRNFLYMKAYADRLVELGRKYGVAAIHSASNFVNGLAGLSAARRLGVPFTYEMRGLWYLSRMVREPSFAYSQVCEYERKMEATVVCEADTVVTLSEALRQELIRWGVETGKVTLIPNAVDINKFVPQRCDRELKQKLGLQGKFVVGFIGSLKDYEGLDLLVEAVGQLASSGLSIGLLVVGDGYSRPRLEEVAAAWGRECVVFVGRVPFAEVNRYYTICDVCAFPRRGYQVCRYVPPLKPLEAMAMEKPVIVSSLLPLLEMVEDGNTGLVCGVDDGESLQAAIARLYQHPSMAATLGKKARQWVEENRSWEKIAAKYVAMYGKLGR